MFKYKIGDEIYLLDNFLIYRNCLGVIKKYIFEDEPNYYYVDFKFKKVDVFHGNIDHKKSLQLKREKILKML